MFIQPLRVLNVGEGVAHYSMSMMHLRPIGFVMVLFCVICPSTGAVAPQWCELPLLRLGRASGPTLQEVQYSTAVYAGILLSSTSVDYRETLRVASTLHNRAQQLGVTLVLVDQHGTEDERLIVRKYGEGPLPRLVIWGEMPKQWAARPTLLSTAVDDRHTDELVSKLEQAVADLGVAKENDERCPRRRLKRGTTTNQERLSDL